MPIFGKSKIGNSCFIDPSALIGYPHKDELNFLENNQENIIEKQQAYNYDYSINTIIPLNKPPAMPSATPIDA